MRQVVITGLGVVTAAGRGVDDFRAVLKAGRSGIKPVSAAAGLPLSIGALLTDFDFDTTLEEVNDWPEDLHSRARSVARRAPLSGQAAVLSATEAWCQAELVKGQVDPSRVSLVVAGHNINQRYSYDLQQKYRGRLEYLTPRYGVHFLDTDHVGILSELLHIRGEGLTVGGASASGNVGLIQAARLIRWGIADICLVVGSLMNLSPLELQALYGTGALGGKTITEADKACRPFDRDREGFIYGQGSGCLILESQSSAERRGVRPLAKLVGWGMNLDGNRLTDPNQAGEAKAMRQALQMAGLSPGDVDYLNTHGTASVLGDAAEIAAIKEVFGKHSSELWLNSTKSLTGHCLTSAGVIEAIATIIQMTEGFLHPNLNLEHPLDESCCFVGNQSQTTTTNIALSNSFGFGGINSSIVLSH